MSDQQCEICHKDIHSITTRRINDHYFCMNCGDTIKEGMNKITEEFVNRVSAMTEAYGLEKAVQKTVEFMQL